jgi:hypothetical protein
MKCAMSCLVVCLLGVASLPIDLKNEASVIAGEYCTGVPYGDGCPPPPHAGLNDLIQACADIDVTGVGSGYPGTLLTAKPSDWNCDDIVVGNGTWVCGPKTISSEACFPQYAWIPFF